MGLATITSIVTITIPIEVSSAPKILTERQNQIKKDWSELLKQAPDLTISDGTLVDVTGAKSNCHIMSVYTSPEERGVMNINCWAKTARTFPPLAAQWVASNTKMSEEDFINPAPISVGNTMTDNINRQHDCHLTNYLLNNKGTPVTSWTCFSKVKYKPIR